MSVPFYLEGYTSDIIEHSNSTSFILEDSEGGQEFKIFACAEYDPETGLYTDTPSDSSLFIAESVKTKEKITLFDNASHGYDNMFVKENSQKPRLVSELPFSPCRIMAQFGYEIPYDEEKKEYTFNSDGECVLIDGRSIPWEQVKADGYDWVTLCFENEEGKWEGFVDEELA